MAVLDGSSGNYLFDHYQNHRNTSNKYLPPIPIVVLLSFPCLKQLSFVKCTFPVTIPLNGAQFSRQSVNSALAIEENPRIQQTA